MGSHYDLGCRHEPLGDSEYHTTLPTIAHQRCSNLPPVRRITAESQGSASPSLPVLSLFSHSGFASQEAYRQLWLESLAYGERMRAHDAHQQIIGAMKSLWPVEQQLVEAGEGCGFYLLKKYSLSQ